MLTQGSRPQLNETLYGRRQLRHARWHDEEYMAERRSEVVRVANRIVTGQSRIVEGSRELVRLRLEVVEDEFDPDFRIFVVVDSETDHLPLGKVRERWAPDALETKDEEIRRAEAAYRDEVLRSCRALVTRFGRSV